MKTTKEKCICDAGDHLVMACSGASDVGLLSDKLARSLQLSGKRNMNCLAVIGVGIEKSIEIFKQKDLLVIDGCPVACGKKIVEQHGFTNYKHMIITETGMIKGESPANDENINFVLQKALELDK